MKLLLTADWHLRERNPRSYIGNYWEDQAETIDWVLKLADDNDATVLIAGDVFNSCPSTDYIVQWIIREILNYQISVYSVFGQHDLLHHSLKNINRTPLMIASAADAITILADKSINKSIYGCSWGEDIPSVVDKKGLNILVIHKMLIAGKLWPGQEAIQGKNFLRANPDFDLIVSGDNHKHFIEEIRGRYLVNCGSLMRMTASQFDHQPKVCLYDTNTRELDVMDIPCKPVEEVLTREHLEKEKERDERLDAFVKSLRSDYKVELSFRDNLRKFFDKNEVDKNIQELIWENLE